VKIIRRKVKSQSSLHSGVRIAADTFFFHEKNTGVAHFRIEASPDGRLPADQAAGLLAMHCLVRGQSPSDYVVMVEAGESLLGGVAAKAEKLLQAGRTVSLPVQLSRREEEVLSGIMRSLANKEIAASLNLSERTVKFHVSSLLAKFRVRGRMELAREASRAYLPTSSEAPPERILPPAIGRKVQTVPGASAQIPVQGARIVLLPKRQMTA
jgi:DNA-binding CsgD family transcriptional regulator